MSIMPEHLFAQYVRIIGKGKNTSRSLTREEAFDAFTHILKNEVEPIQLGAFLLLLRVKGEDENEMAGFAEAAQRFIDAPTLAIDIDWPSYAGKHRQQLWYLLSAILLASNGHKIFMHGSSYMGSSRIYCAQILPALGIAPCQNWDDVANKLEKKQLAYMPLNKICPSLDKLFSYRPLLGVRSPANSLVKLVNPLRAPTSLQSVFHPAYLEIHQKAAQLLGHQHSLVMKGEGGEIEFRPDAENRLFLLNNGAASVAKWPRHQAKRQPNLELDNISSDALKQLWSGANKDSYGLDAVISTAAMVLFGSGSTTSEQGAWQIANSYWQTRDPKLLN